MKRIIAISIAALIVAGAAAAQNGAICLFADPAGTDCNLTDDGPGLLSIYVVHMFAPGAMASQFSAPKPSCMAGATYLSDSSPFPVVIGNSQTGVSIGYGACLATPLHILTITYQVTGGTEVDCAYRIRAHPDVANVEAVDCDNNIVIPGGGKTYLNSTLDCVCAEVTAPELGYTPSILDFQDRTNTLSLYVTNLGGGALYWFVSDDQPWIEFSPSSGLDDGTVVVSVDRANLTPGEHTGNINLSSSYGNAAVPVRMDVVAVLWVVQSQLDFGSNATSLYLSIRNTGDGIMSWSASATEPWISLDQTSGQGDREVLVTVDRTGLNAGTHTGYVQVNSDGGNATVLVTMNVGPVLSVDPNQLDYGYYSTVQYFDIENTGSGLLGWGITTETPWITIDPVSGENDATIEVTADRTGLADGHHEGVISIVSNGGEATVPVTIDVGPSLFITPTSLVFSAADITLTFLVRNIGAGTLEWTLAPDSSWIDVNPPSGTDDATIQVTVDRCALELGILHQGSIQVTSNGGDGSVLVLAHGMPRLGVSTNYLEFKEDVIETRTFSVVMLCSDPFDWTASTSTPWITLDPTAGNGPDTVTVSVEWPEGVEEPELWGAIRIFAVGSSEQVTIAVKFFPADILVPTEKKTWGSLKSKFKN